MLPIHGKHFLLQWGNSKSEKKNQHLPSEILK